jgi:transposase
MAAAVKLREDFVGLDLRVLAKATKDAAQGRRLLSLAEIYDGGSRTDAARIGGVGLQTVRDWVLRFNAHGPDGLIDGKAPGNTAKLGAAQRRALAAIVESGPIPAVHGVVRWRLKDLAQWLWDEFGVSLSESTVSRELRALGFRRLTARPRHHAQNAYALEAFKKASRPSWRRSRRACRPAPR